MICTNGTVFAPFYVLLFSGGCRPPTGNLRFATETIRVRANTNFSHRQRLSLPRAMK
jgi:hypothetical protein